VIQLKSQKNTKAPVGFFIKFDLRKFKNYNRKIIRQNQRQPQNKNKERNIKKQTALSQRKLRNYFFSNDYSL